MTKNQVEKFSPLKQEKIEEIIERCKDKEAAKWLAPIARKSQELLASQQYSYLRELGQNLNLEKLNNNLDEIAIFLRDCRLIGAENEKNNNINAGNYVIGAEGVALINEYMASKEKNKNSHEIVVIKNNDFADENGSYQTQNVMKSQKAIHSNFAKKLTEDLIKAKEQNTEFNKTYLIESFGTTGGNHFFAVTVRKNPDEKSPLIDFFDPSNGLLRGNIETLQNAISIGYTGQIAVNATLTKALKDAGLEFDLSKYYNNMEALQMRGSSNCSVFAYEKAYMTSNLSREEHEALLKKHYKFDSPFGGKTEVEIDIKAIEQSESGKAENLQLNMPAQYMAITHFNSNAKEYLKDMEQFTHQRKERSNSAEESISDEIEESVKARRDRYLRSHSKLNPETQETETFFTNELITQKHFRQKYGHLFEIVTNPKFAELGEEFLEQELPSNEFFRNSVYSPKYLPSEMPENPIAAIIINGKKYSEEEKTQGHEDIRGLNQILPFPVRIVKAKYNEEKNTCEALLYGSERLATRLQAWAQENNFGIEVKIDDFQANGFEFTGLDSSLAKRSEILLKIPVTEESITKISSSDEKKFLYSTPLPIVNSNQLKRVLPEIKEQERK